MYSTCDMTIGQVNVAVWSAEMYNNLQTRALPGWPDVLRLHAHLHRSHALAYAIKASAKTGLQSHARQGDVSKPYTGALRVLTAIAEPEQRPCPPTCASTSQLHHLQMPGLSDPLPAQA